MVGAVTAGPAPGRQDLPYVLHAERSTDKHTVWEHECRYWPASFDHVCSMQSVYPLGRILQTVHLEAPAARKPTAGPLTTVTVEKEWVQNGVRHLEVLMQLPAPGWGVVNITSSGLQSWSFTESVSAVARAVRPQVRSNFIYLVVPKSSSLFFCSLVLQRRP